MTLRKIIFFQIGIKANTISITVNRDHGEWKDFKISNKKIGLNFAN